jgi:DNA-binding MarR family transcriptional regulator
MTTGQTHPAEKSVLQHSVTDLSPDFVQAFQALIGEVFRLNGALLSAGDRLARDLGISPARWQTIATIRNQPMTVSDIARRLGLTRQSVQRTVKLLIEEGLARQQPNPEHRRSHLVALTRRGEKVMHELSNRQVPLTGLFTRDQGLSVEDLRQLADQLKTIRETAERVGH